MTTLPTTPTSDPFARIEDAVEDLRAGKMVILVDDEDRENEGDFVMAAQWVTPEAITLMTRHASGIITVPMPEERLQALHLDLMVQDNSEAMRTAFTVTVDAREGDFVMAAQWVTPEAITLMTRHASGIITVPMPEERLQALHLDLMVQDNSEAMRTAFTVTVDAREGTTTGSSAHDRALTIRRLADPSARPTEFNRPGHVNPLMARRGGVLKRSGHTEAAVDLMKLAGLQPVGVICEIMDDTGEMMRVPQLAELAAKFDLKLITIADLIKYRRRTEKLIRKVAEADLPTKYGRFRAHAYVSDVDVNEYVAFVMGDVADGSPTLCRIHSSCVTGDLLDSLRCDCGDQLHLALQKIADDGRGVLLYIEQEGRGIGLVNKMRAYQLQDQGADTVEANEMLGLKADMRDYGIGAQILVDLGLKRLRMMTNNPAKKAGLEGFDLEIAETVPLRTEPNPHNARYLATKREKMGHLLPEEAAAVAVVNGAAPADEQDA